MRSFPLFPESASSLAPDVDALYAFLVGLTVFFSALIFFLVFFFAIKYRRRSPNERPPALVADWRLELFWTAVPLLISMGIFVWGAVVFVRGTTPPADTWEIFVVGKRWMWKVQHPSGRREINELHVPVGQAVKLTMASEDVIHSFFVPAFRTKMDVLPGRYTTLWFRPTRVGRYRLFCAEYCGTQHSRMIGWVTVMNPADYQRWLEQKGADGAGTTPAESGAAVFKRLRCDTCHGAGSFVKAPKLEGLYGSDVRLADGRTVKADEEYLRESILRPHEKLAAGYEPVMPAYAGQVGEDEVLQVIAYLKSLPAAGETKGGSA